MDETKIRHIAKTLCFDRIQISKYSAMFENSLTRVEVRQDIETGKIEISYPSAGSPRPTDDELILHSKMIQNSLFLKSVLEIY